MFWRSVTFSECGPIRRVNADCVLADDTIGFYAVADGVGSTAASVRASRTAVEEARRIYAAEITDRAPNLEGLVERAYSAYLDRLADLPEKPSTTLTILTLKHDTLNYVSVGDSPAFLIDQDRIALITRQHTMVDQSRIFSNFSELKSLDGSNVLVNTLGDNPPRPVTYPAIEVRSPFRFMVCTDGVMDFLLQHDLGRLSTESKSGTELVRRIQATAAGSRPRDNYSGIVIDLLGEAL